MVSNEGGWKTAQKLLATEKPSEGFVVLWEKKRLDLTVEYHILLPEFEELFTPEERKIAKDRLEEYGFSL
jgi:hypothetical protein